MNNPTLFNFICAALLSVTLLSSCGSRQEQTLFNAASDVNAENLKDIYVVNDRGEEDIYYKIKLNDLIAISNLQNKDWGATRGVAANPTSAAPTTTAGQNITTYRVDVDGMVHLPAVGKVLLAGLTRREATRKLQDLYGSKEYLNDPIIDLSIVNLKVTLLGEFAKQGNFLLTRDNTSLIDIIGESGGLTKTADPKALKIIRGDKNNPEIIYVNLNDINSLASRKLILQNNDLLYIPPTKGAAMADRLQKTNNILQPLLVVVNLGVLIYTLSK